MSFVNKAISLRNCGKRTFMVVSVKATFFFFQTISSQQYFRVQSELDAKENMLITSPLRKPR